MPEYFLRKVQNGYMTLFEDVSIGKSYNEIHGYDWVKSNQKPADLLTAFGTKKGVLSLYKINDKSDVDLCLSIIACIHSGNAPSGSDFLIIDLDFFKDSNITTPIRSNGNSRIKWVDELHHDLIHLTPEDIVMLVNHLPKILVRADSFEKVEISEEFLKLQNQRSSK